MLATVNTFAPFTATHYFVVVCHIKPRENTLRFVVKTQQNWNKCIYKVLHVTVNIVVFPSEKTAGSSAIACFHGTLLQLLSLSSPTNCYSAHNESLTSHDK